MATAKCPRCGEVLRVRDDAVGGNQTCPTCGTIFKTKLPQAKAPPTPESQAKAPAPIARGPRHVEPSPFDFTAAPPPAAPLPFVDEPPVASAAQGAPAPSPGTRAGVYCFGCGAWIHREAESCPKCGAPQLAAREKPEKASDPLPAVVVMMITIVCGVVAGIGFVATGMTASPVAAAISLAAGVGTFLFSIASIAVGAMRGGVAGVAAVVIGILFFLGICCAGLLTLIAISEASARRRF